MKIKELMELANSCPNLTKPRIFQNQKFSIKKIAGLVVSQDTSSLPEADTTDFFSSLDFNKMSNTERMFFTAMEQHISKNDIRTMMTLMPKKSNMPFLVQIIENLKMEKRR